ncbi:hypothetical protein Tcan_15783 [Toxocara canis]|uniref:Transmembrane protein n=1 Tax=Toxocara canis TaxID=6265 RepID=A0A0B2V2F6_TOXCA|nr:hypothetical protein Tcan_15783 [Toxocara canis]
MTTPEPRFYPAKKTVSVLAVLQLMLATIHFVENSLILHRNYNDFYHAESRLVVAVVWAFTLCWILVTLVLLLAIITNRPSLLLPHLVFSVIWLPFKLIILLILFTSSARISSVLFTSFTALIIAVSIPCEWHCYSVMHLLL